MGFVMGLEHSVKDEFQWEQPNSVMAKVSTFIVINTRGNDYPKEIWLNKKDYMQLYAELQQIQQIDRGHGVLRVPEKKVMAGFRAVYYDGAEIIYSHFAEPLPNNLTDMDKWINRPFVASETE